MKERQCQGRVCTVQLICTNRIHPQGGKTAQNDGQIRHAAEAEQGGAHSHRQRRSHQSAEHGTARGTGCRRILRGASGLNSAILPRQKAIRRQTSGSDGGAATLQRLMKSQVSKGEQRTDSQTKHRRGSHTGQILPSCPRTGGQQQAKRQLTCRLHHLRDGGGNHVSLPLKVASHGRGQADEQNGWRNGHHRRGGRRITEQGRERTGKECQQHASDTTYHHKGNQRHGENPPNTQAAGGKRHIPMASV